MKQEKLSDIDRLNHLTNEVKNHPSNIQLQVLLGAMLFEPFHQTDQAIEILEKVIEKEPDEITAHFWLAKCVYHDYMDVERAQQILQKALELDNKRADCLSLMASVITDLGATAKERLYYLEQAVQQAPDWISPRQYLAQTLMELGALDKAETEVIIALSLVNTAKNIQPSNSVEEYYESAVTGRIWPHVQQELTDLLEAIRTKRLTMPVSNETAPMNVIIARTPNSKQLIAQLWYENEQWGEISQQQGEFKLEIYSKPNGRSWQLKYEQALKVIQEAKDKLLKPSNCQYFQTSRLQTLYRRGVTGK